MKKFLLIGCLAGVFCFGGCASLPTLDTAQDTLSPEEHVTLGDVYLAKQERQLATQQYKAAVKANPKNVPALMALGDIAFEDRQWGDARDYFRKALKSAPQDPAVINNLAMVDLQEGKNLKGAKKSVEEALPDAGPVAPYLWDTLANIAIVERRYDDARDALRHAEAASPGRDPQFAQRLQESRDRVPWVPLPPPANKPTF